MPVLATGVLLIAKGALDHSPERIVEMRVQSAWADEDDGAKFHVRTLGEGESQEYAFTGSKPSAEMRVRARWRSGALGWNVANGRRRAARRYCREPLTALAPPCHAARGAALSGIAVAGEAATMNTHQRDRRPRSQELRKADEGISGRASRALGGASA
jgi:hypothetical protein